MNEPRTPIYSIGIASDELRADAVMPVQFYSTRRTSASLEPALRLMEAVLFDAVRSFQRNFEARHKPGQQEFREAKFWIFHDKQSGPFSYEDVCEVLGVDPRRLRELIVRWEKERRSSDRQHMTRGIPIDRAKRMQSRREKRAEKQDEKITPLRAD